jgi:hypothetical protein
MLWDARRTWGGLLRHLFDQGSAGFPWVSVLVQSPVRLVLRWRADSHLGDLLDRTKSPGQLTGRLRAWARAPGWDAVHQRTIQWSVLALPVPHPDSALAGPSFWLVVCRRDHHLPPWYRLSNEPINSVRPDATAVGRHEGLDHALLVPSHWYLDPSHPRAFHALTHSPQSALDGFSPFHSCPRPLLPWRCLQAFTRFGMNHVFPSL